MGDVKLKVGDKVKVKNGCEEFFIQFQYCIGEVTEVHKGLFADLVDVLFTHPTSREGGYIRNVPSSSLEKINKYKDRGTGRTTRMIQKVISSMLIKENDHIFVVGSTDSHIKYLYHKTSELCKNFHISEKHISYSFFDRRIYYKCPETNKECCIHHVSVDDYVNKLAGMYLRNPIVYFDYWTFEQKTYDCSDFNNYIKCCIHPKPIKTFLVCVEYNDKNIDVCENVINFDRDNLIIEEKNQSHYLYDKFIKTITVEK